MKNFKNKYFYILPISASFTFFLLYILYLSLITAFAADEFSVNLECDSEIATKKSFSAELMIHSSEPLGAFYVQVEYPSEIVEFKKCELSNKSENEYINEHHENGNINILYATKQPNITNKKIQLLFRTNETEINDQIISADLSDIITYNKTDISLNKNCNVKFSVVSDRRNAEEKTVSSKNENSSKRGSSSNISSTESSKSKKSDSKVSETSENESSKSEKSKNVSENSRVLEHFDKKKYKDNLSEESDTYYIIGAVILITVIFIVAISFVRRINKKYPE